MSEGLQVVMSPVQMAAVLSDNTVTEAETLQNRLLGGLSVAMSTVELAGATILCAAPDPRTFRILCHIKNSTATSHYSVAHQNKWLTATMSNSSSGSALSIFPVRSLAPDKAASTDCFHSGKRL